VAVGNPKEYGKPLSTLGEVKELDISIPEPKRQESKADPKTLARGKELLQRAQQALGGADKLAAVKDFTLAADVEVSTPQGTMKVRQTSQWIAPDLHRSTQELPFGKIIVFWDGKTGWISTPKGTSEIPEPVARQVRSESFRNFFKLFLADRDPSRKVNAVDENTIEVTSDSGESVRVQFDPATGLPARMMYESITMQGAPGSVTMNITGWTEVEGIKLAKNAVIEQNGQKFAESTFAEAKINSGLTAEELGQKP
jgi:hypothetical protein